MKITNALRERFCKDNKLPIKEFDEKIFESRLWAFEQSKGAVEKYKAFCDELDDYATQEEYFAEYNRVKDEAIKFIKESEGWQNFNKDSCIETVNKICNFREMNIYSQSFVDGKYISIDICKANFSILRRYDPAIFDGAETWEEFISKFTSSQNIINSKYIRQVILGNCNPSRVIGYEKAYTITLCLQLYSACDIPDDAIVSLSNDEIIFKADKVDKQTIENALATIDTEGVPLRVEEFYLREITNNGGYVKEIINEDGTITREYKGVDGEFAHLIIKSVEGKPITTDDRYFNYHGFRAYITEVPKFNIKKLSKEIY